MAYDARIFYAPGVSSSNATFGKGKWYLPSVGELMNAYGYNLANVSTGATSGVTGAGKTAINAALNTLAEKGVDAAAMSGEYWSSSEGGFNATTGQDLAWVINFNTGAKYDRVKYQTSNQTHLRTFVQVDGVRTGAQVGDVMYSDKTYGKAADYDGSKTAVGIITEVAENGTSVKVVSLNDLEFSSTASINGLSTADPFHNTYDYSVWSYASADVPNLTNYSAANMLATMQEEEAAYEMSKKLSEWNGRYNELLSQYDAIIADSGYKGVNLLKGESMEVTFNEDRDHKLIVTGSDVRSVTLGLNAADWETIADIRNSIDEIKVTVSALRTAASDIGNNTSIIEIRQSFTESLISVLEEGADKLTLADMNEASAEYLMLQTRQSLAVNALSLATESERGILMLF